MQFFSAACSLSTKPRNIISLTGQHLPRSVQDSLLGNPSGLHRSGVIQLLLISFFFLHCHSVRNALPKSEVQVISLVGTSNSNVYGKTAGSKCKLNVASNAQELLDQLADKLDHSAREDVAKLPTLNPQSQAVRVVSLGWGALSWFCAFYCRVFGKEIRGTLQPASVPVACSALVCGPGDVAEPSIEDVSLQGLAPSMKGLGQRRALYFAVPKPVEPFRR